MPSLSTTCHRHKKSFHHISVNLHFHNPKSQPRIGIIPRRLAPLFIPLRLILLIVDLSQLCRAHKLWLKRVDKHSGLLVWESGNLILCLYLAGPASRHLPVNVVSGKAEKIGVTLVREEGTHPGPFMLLTCTSLGPWCSSQQWGTGPAADSFISWWLNRRQNPSHRQPQQKQNCGFLHPALTSARLMSQVNKGEVMSHT